MYTDDPISTIQFSGPNHISAADNLGRLGSLYDIQSYSQRPVPLGERQMEMEDASQVCSMWNWSRTFGCEGREGR